jgi:hypothetical protein
LDALRFLPIKSRAGLVPYRAFFADTSAAHHRSNSPASLDRSDFYATVRSITGSCDGRTDADLGEHGVAADEIQLRWDRKTKEPTMHTSTLVGPSCFAQRRVDARLNRA